MTSFVDCPEAGQSFHNQRAGIGGKNQLFLPPTGAENCCSQGQQIRLSFSIPQYFTVIFFPALNHDECGGTGKRMHATHRLKEHIPTLLICYLTARGRLTVCQKNWKRKRRKLVNQLLIVASISVSLAARKDISQATYAMFFFNTTRVVSYFTRTFKNNLKVTVTRDDSQRRFSAPHSVARLEQGCNYSKQCRNNVATLCCAKSRRCESSRVTLPLR